MSLVWSASPSTVYTELTATYTFKDDDVRAVYIDWDDGPSNKLSEANFEWRQFTEPIQSGTATHTYTASGTFNPVVRTINSQGVASRFYAYDDVNTSTNILTPFTQDALIAPVIINDSAATAIMRLENKAVHSGIDNSIFEKEGAKVLNLFAPPLCTRNELAAIASITVEVDCIVDYSMTTTGTAATTVGGSQQSLVTLSKTLTGGDLYEASGMNAFTSTGGLISKVLKITYTNPKLDGGSTDYDDNKAFNYLKLFVCVEGDDSDFHPIGYVSAGSPIKKSNDPLRTVTLDFSQSRAAASNISLNKYRYDIGKAWFNPAYQWNTVTGATADVYEFFGDNTVQTSSTKYAGYTYNMVRPDGLNGDTGTKYTAFANGGTADWARNYVGGSASDLQKHRTDQFLIDDFGRFAPQYHLTRLSVQPNSASNGIDTEMSSLIANKPNVYRITPAGLSTAQSSGIWESGGTTKLDLSAMGTASGNYTHDYTEKNFQNGSANMVSFLSGNTQTWLAIDTNGTSNELTNTNEYFLLLWDSKTNKLGFNIANYANSLISKNLSGSGITEAEQYKIAGVSYLAINDAKTNTQHAYWKSVEFEDTTKAQLELRNTSTYSYDTESNSLSQSGYVSFDMPLDWESTTLASLCGGQFGATFASGAYDFKVTGGSAAQITWTAGGSATFGGVLTFTNLTFDGSTGLSDLGTANDIGAFKYIAICTDAGGAANVLNKPFWVANGTSAGANAALDTLYLTAGEDIVGSYVPSGIAGSTNPEFLLRRVNVYDIVDGVNKVEKQGSDATQLTPVDAEASAFPCTYFSSDITAKFGEGISDAWGGSDKFALKITVSGSGTADGCGSGINGYPEIFNIFDATEGDSAYVKEIDDSAYNLNSLPLTSGFSVTRAGNYFTAITRKGKIFIARTGDVIQDVSFASVALGDESESAATQFGKTGPDSLYGHLHTVRKLQAENVRVYWDEPQKDGTFVRFWGIITSVSEDRAAGGPRAINSYSFNMTVQEVALLENDGKLMTDIFPLGGVLDERDFT